MKKISIVLLTLILLFCLTVTAFAEQINVYDKNKDLVKSVVFSIGLDTYFIDGKTPGIKMDAKPFIESGRTFVPVRYLGNALGITDEFIGWASPKVTFKEPGYPTVELAIGKKEIKSDGKARTMDTAPLLRNSRTYLPARFVAEALGYEVDWDAEEKVVICWPKGTEKPNISNVVDFIKGEQPKPNIPDDADVINLQGKGEPVTNYEFSKYLKPTSKVNWLTYDEFNSNSYYVNGVTTHGMRVTEDDVFITQKGGCGTVCLYEGGDIFRPRGTSGPQEVRNQAYEYGYTVTLESDTSGGWGMCDIKNVSHIFFDRNDGTFLAIENPLYKGGK